MGKRESAREMVARVGVLLGFCRPFRIDRERPEETKGTTTTTTTPEHGRSERQRRRVREAKRSDVVPDPRCDCDLRNLFDFDKEFFLPASSLLQKLDIPFFSLSPFQSIVRGAVMEANVVDGQQQYCLRWNNHQANLLKVFSKFLGSEELTDVALAADGNVLRAHKVCNLLFENAFLVQLLLAGGLVCV